MPNYWRICKEFPHFCIMRFQQQTTKMKKIEHFMNNKIHIVASAYSEEKKKKNNTKSFIIDKINQNLYKCIVLFCLIFYRSFFFPDFCSDHIIVVRNIYSVAYGKGLRA